MAVAPHYHRCKACNKRMDHGCIDASCREGLQWVILCLRCYEALSEELSEAEAFGKYG
jgi:hypothetical protein